MPRCNKGELVIIEAGGCMCFFGHSFVTREWTVREGKMFWKLPVSLPACVHFLARGIRRVVEVNDAMCRPVRPPPSPALRKHNYWPYPPNPAPTFSGRKPPPAPMHQPI